MRCLTSVFISILQRRCRKKNNISLCFDWKTWRLPKYKLLTFRCLKTRCRKQITFLPPCVAPSCAEFLHKIQKKQGSKCDEAKNKILPLSSSSKSPRPVSDEADADHRKITYQLNTCSRRPGCTRGRGVEPITRKRRR